MGNKKTEACGRCSLTTVIDATEGEEQRDILGEHRIELPEDTVRRVVPHHVALSGVKARLTDAAMRLTFGRSR